MALDHSKIAKNRLPGECAYNMTNNSKSWNDKDIYLWMTKKPILSHL
jgi:hypothetical protein